MTPPPTGQQWARESNEIGDHVGGDLTKKRRRGRPPKAGRTPGSSFQVELREPTESGGLAELIEALAQLIADVCVDARDTNVLPSAQPTNTNHQKKAA